MPGVTIKTETLSGPASNTAPIGARYFVAGQFERGPVDKAVRVRSLAELVAVYGDRVPYSAAWNDLQVFFSEGGAEAYVIRTVGTAATKGTATIVDDAAGVLATLTARDPGAASAGITVTVALNATTATHVDVTVAVDDRPNLVERYRDLATTAEVVQALAGSKVVSAVAGASTKAITTGVGSKTLSAGSDARASITGATYMAALGLIAPEVGHGVFAVPGMSAETIGTEALAYAAETGRMYIGALGVAATRAEAAAAVESFDSEHGGVWYPWVRVPSTGNQTMLVSPEGYVAAARTRAHQEAGGAWQPGAGELSVARYVLGPASEVTAAQAQELDDARVNVIRVIAGTTRVYGWRSLSQDTANWSLFSCRDTVNAVVAACRVVLEPYVFRPIDGRGRLLASARGSLIGVCAPIADVGGLYQRTNDDGDVLDPGYAVEVSEALNPIEALAQNRLAAKVSVRVSPVGALIELTVAKASLTTAL